jgi:TldD protein
MNGSPYQTPDPELLGYILSRASAGRRFDLADLFCEQRTSLKINLLDGEVTRIVWGREQGAAVRTAGSAGGRFEYTDGLDQASLQQLASGGAGPGTGAVWSEILCSSTDSDPDGEGRTLLLQALRGIAGEATRGEPLCRRVETSCYAHRQRVWILDEGGQLCEDQRSALQVTVRVLVDGNWGTAHYGSAWSVPALQPPQARELARLARCAALAAGKARPAPAGPQTVVLAAGSGGILLHEACGHLLEADYVLPGHSPFAGRLGKPVASPLVTAVDDPTLPGLPASQLVDDEGRPTGRKLLLDHGVVAAFLCGRREAAAGGAGFSPGNARRRSFRHPPLPRMSNTMILAGDTPPEEIIRQTADGIYASRLSAGRADPSSGRFRFTVAEGALIEGGKLTWPLDGAVICGSGPQALAAIDLVGNDARMDDTAAGCTKAGQTIAVAVGHPTLRIGSLTVEPLGVAGGGRR